MSSLGPERASRTLITEDRPLPAWAQPKKSTVSQAKLVADVVRLGDAHARSSSSLMNPVTGTIALNEEGKPVAFAGASKKAAFWAMPASAGKVRKYPGELQHGKIVKRIRDDKATEHKVGDSAGTAAAEAPPCCEAVKDTLALLHALVADAMHTLPVVRQLRAQLDQPATQHHAQFLLLKQEHLPLMQFDSAEHDPIDFENSDVYPMPARSPWWNGKAWRWRKVEVQGYDAATQRFQAEFDHMTLKAVHRLNVCFDSEDKMAFATRLATAALGRQRAKLELRARYFLSRHPDLADVQPLQDEWLFRIYLRAMLYKVPSERRAYLHAMEDARRQGAFRPPTSDEQGPSSQRSKGKALLQVARANHDLPAVAAQSSRLLEVPKSPTMADRVQRAAPSAEPGPTAGGAAGLMQGLVARSLLRTVLQPRRGPEDRSDEALHLAEQSMLYQHDTVAAACEANPMLASILTDLSALYDEAVRCASYRYMHKLATGGMWRLNDTFQRVLQAAQDLHLPGPPPALPAPPIGKVRADFSGAAFVRRALSLAGAFAVGDQQVLAALQQLHTAWSSQYAKATSMAVAMPSQVLAPPGQAVETPHQARRQLRIGAADTGLLELSWPTTLREFEAAQTEHAGRVSKLLGQQFVRDAAVAVMDNTGSDRFDVFMQALDMYHKSEERRLVQRINLALQSYVAQFGSQSRQRWSAWLARCEPPDAVLEMWHAHISNGVAPAPAHVAQLLHEAQLFMRPLFTARIVADRKAPAEWRSMLQSDTTATALASCMPVPYERRGFSLLDQQDIDEIRAAEEALATARAKVHSHRADQGMAAVEPGKEAEDRDDASELALMGMRRIDPLLVAALHQNRVAVATAQAHLASMTQQALNLGVSAAGIMAAQPAQGRVAARLSPSPLAVLSALQLPLEQLQQLVAAIPRADKQIMSLMPFAHAIPPLLCTTTKPSPIALQVMEQLFDGIQRAVHSSKQAITPALGLLCEVQALLWLLDVVPKSLVQRLRARQPAVTHAQLHSEAERYQILAEHIQAVIPDSANLGILQVKLTELRAALLDAAQGACDAVLLEIAQQVTQESAHVDERYTALVDRLTQPPTNEDELVSLQHFIAELPKRVSELRQQEAGILQVLRSLDVFSYCVPGEHLHQAWALAAWPMQVEMAKDEALYAMEGRRNRMVAQLEKDKVAFDRALLDVETEVAAFKLTPAEELPAAATDRANKLDATLRKLQDTVEDFNAREKAFGFPASEYPALDQVADGFEPFFKVWTAFADFSSKTTQWLSGPISQQAPAAMEADVQDCWAMGGKLSRQLEEDFPEAAKVAQQLRAAAAKFRKYVPLVRCLASPALQLYHWEDLTERLQKESLEFDDALTLQALLNEGFLDHMHEVEDVSVVAEKEHSLRASLAQMQAEWTSIEVEVAAYKSTGTFVIRGTDDVELVLDDHIVKTQTMLGSPYVTHIRDECKTWERTLSVLQRSLVQWLQLQRTWLYLEPIFGSDDIMRQLPNEGRKFATVNQLYRSTASDIADNPVVMHLASKPELLDKLVVANETLDKIQKNLNDYLETKRQAFPRFYFLSNDGLLEILSQTKEPRTVQRHLDKCFEGISRIAFRGEQPGGDAADLAIIEMVSAEGEHVQLVQPVDPNSAGHKGQVEVWLTALEKSMRLTVKDFVRAAMEDYDEPDRAAWVLRWPAQAVLNVGQLFWTQGAEQSMRRAGAVGLAQYRQRLDDQLADIVQLVRGELSSGQRITLGALVVIDVHARDVIADMVEMGTAAPHEFNWMAQLRYYWEHSPDPYQRYGKEPHNMMVRIVNATQMYGYEYLGNSSRLVITPLTDRCYRTLMSAVSLLYGGAPAGPAGTGKTETTKDMGRSMAIPTIVTNCSDQLDVEAMAKFFKGLAASGSWACFDEFNRITLEVLSVVAQQIQTITDAKRAGVSTFNFEGVTLRFNPLCAVFITMNPGYAGRQELPDNLKALFRPCAMMVPDYALIATIKLYSFGFSTASALARKVTQVLRLASELLSSQKHYDYGMRAVFSILVRAGKLRQELGSTWDEDLIVLRSINDVNLPKFTANDLPLFTGITQDLFPGACLPQPDYAVLHTAIREAAAGSGLQPKDIFVKAVVQLQETIAVRHGLMVVGATGSGKSAAISTLATALSSQPDYPNFGKVKCHYLNPKAITQGQLYGKKDENTMEWTDGVLAVIYRTAATDEQPNLHWVVLDGPVDAVWIEDMNTVLDDNKKLCLSSGEIIRMSPRMRMIFETDSLAEASPATVSRVGMVYLEPQRLGWRPYLQSWAQHLPGPLQQPGIMASLLGLAEWIFPPVLFLLRSSSVDTMCPITDLELTHSFCKLFASLVWPAFGRRAHETSHEVPPRLHADLQPSGLPVGWGEGEDAYGCQHPEGPGVHSGVPEPAEDHALKVAHALFLFSVVWSMGSTVCASSRPAFDHFLKGLLAHSLDEHPLWREFLTKHPNYDAMRAAGSLAARAAEGDVRKYDAQYGRSDAKRAAQLLFEMRDQERTRLLASGTSVDELPTTLQQLEAPPAEDPDAEPEAGAADQARWSGRFEEAPLQEGELQAMACSVPAEHTLYDYSVSLDKGQWQLWSQFVPRYDIAPDAQWQSIIVPTADTVRHEWLLHLLMHSKRNVLVVGDTGTGKSATLLDKLFNKMHHSFVPLTVTFSARTSALQTQHAIDAKCVRRRKGVFGPPLGSTTVVFVDDLNMPAKEEYGAQPPVEILRQWAAYQGWYDLADKDHPFMRVVDTQMVAAMGPPGGGRTTITQRMMRHFNVLGFVPFSAQGLEFIFYSVLSWSARALGGPVKAAVKSVVQAGIALYSKVCQDLLPTPAKSHYLFNLRDLSNLFQGMHLASQVPAMVRDDKYYLRVWGHEASRVFRDRLLDDADRAWFDGALAGIAKQHFNLAWSTVLDAAGSTDPTWPLLFSSFVDLKTRAYIELPDRAAAVAAAEAMLEEYNSMGSKVLDLTLFTNAIEHVCRIVRVLMLPLGHSLLVGVGGSGRRSLATLATYIMEYDLFSIEISKSYGLSEWRDDIKRVLTKAGAAGKPTVWLFSDTQIKSEAFVEDINNILNNGEVPNLFESDELAAVLEETSRAAKAAHVVLGTHAETWAYFVSQVRANLHVVLCFSPVGEAFRTRLRQFPSLVNCCAIDWFSAWPHDALQAVGEARLRAVELGSERDGVLATCVLMQLQASELATAYAAQVGRHVYVTPTSYLELLDTFTSMLASKREEITSARERYLNGLDKLAETEGQVDVMKAELQELQPQLKVAATETAAMLEKIETASAETAVVKDTVSAEEAAANEQAGKANAIREDCERDLAAAEPILKDAQAALKTINKADIAVVKKLGKPPAGVKLVMEAVCIMMSLQPKKVPSPAGSGKIDDYWPVATKDLLSRSDFLKLLQEYDKDNIAAQVVDKITSYIADPAFDPEVIKSSSTAAAGLCRWVHALVKYNEIVQVVRPKRGALAAAQAEADAAMATLATKQAELQEVMDKLHGLQAELRATMDKKAELERRASDCSAKLHRAEALITGLGGEKARWVQESERLQAEYANVTGDILLSSGFVAYLGAFTAPFRAKATAQWCSHCRLAGVSAAGDWSLQRTLGNPVTIRDWTIHKLPNDTFSIDNSIMLHTSKRWPLMIDPQGQANNWIRSMQGDNGLRVLKLSTLNYTRSLEAAIQFGQPVLIENLPEAIDPVLEPLLTRQFTKAGGITAVRLGDATVEYDPRFQLYLTTKLRNPHYPPETCVAVNLLNFAATQEGLADQMLGLVVKRMAEQLEAQREQLVLQDAENQATLASLENTILRLLKEASGDILEDETLIDTLKESKATANEVMAQVARAEKTQVRIERTRAGYAPVAKRAATLFFCVMDMGSIDPMYQYSLDWFIGLFRLAMDRAEANGKEVTEAVRLLNATFTAVVYDAVCRSLFERHKLLLSWQLTARILVAENLLPMEQLRFLLRGCESEPSDPLPNSAEFSWITTRVWRELSGLGAVGGMRRLQQHVVQHAAEWAQLSDAPDAWARVTSLCAHPDLAAQATDASGAPAVPAAGAGGSKGHRRGAHHARRGVDVANELEQLLEDEGSHAHVGLFQRLLLVRALRPDALVPAVQQFVSVILGPKFIDPPPFDLQLAFRDSTCTSPLVFVLSSGADPMAELDKLAAKFSKASSLAKVSLGQGQGPIATAKVLEGIDRGNWVVLQNCHLAASWMPELERITEGFDPEKIHPEFRLWLTSMPSPDFPASILQNGVKVTVEPAAGLRANMLGSFNTIDDAWWTSLASCTPDKSALFRALTWGLCFFHALMRERRRFGPLGFNIPYEFSESDLRITLDQLQLFLVDEQATSIPWEALSYLTGECNYGGRVTDDRDRRCVAAHLQDVYTPGIAQTGFKFDPEGVFTVPDCIVGSSQPSCSVEAVKSWVRALPMVESPNVFGLHNNANIAVALAQSTDLTGQALQLMPEPPAQQHASRSPHEEGQQAVEQASTTELGAPEQEDQVDAGHAHAISLAERLAEQAPGPIDVEVVRVLFPIKYEDSMNTVLIQECLRYNKLLVTVKRTLSDLRRALAGEMVLTSELEAMQFSVERGQVPTAWAAVAYPSMKPLGAWMKDLAARIGFLTSWIQQRASPSVYWLGGFYFTQSFLTAVRQNTARRRKIAIDEIVWQERVLDEVDCQAASQPAAQPPDEGAWVSGLFLVGAAWNVRTAALCQSQPRQLFCELPIMFLLPLHQDNAAEAKHSYECPVYKTSERRGTLSTTGHSTNYVTSIRLPMAPADSSATFTKAGVAGLLALDD